MVDSTPAVERSWRTLAAEHGVEVAFGSFHGIPAAQAIPGVLGGGLDDAQVAAAVRRLAELEVADTEGVVPLPGAQKAITSIPPDRVAIATSCVADLAAVRIAAAGLVPPRVVVTADMTPIGKPDPAPYLLAAERLGVDPSRCLVVEDAPAGLAAARAAGARSLAVTTTHAAADLDADLIVAGLPDVRFEPAPDGVRLVVL